MIDKILSKLLDAIDDENDWDIEAYAAQGLEYIEKGGEINLLVKEELTARLNRILDSARRRNLENKKKSDLIETIVNFKG